MADTTTFARPYALALFRLAREKNELARWSTRLQRLAAIAADREMAKVISNPRLSKRQVADLFLSLAGEPGNRELAAFIGLLAENGRLDVLPEISAIFEQLKREDEGVKDALIASAFPLDESQLKALTRRLEAHFGCRLHPRVEVDPSLIGGVKVVVDDQVLDASVRGKLAAMATALKN